MNEWITQLRSALADERRAVLVTLAGARGSTPREAGARMIVTARSVLGTIGGGHLEFEATGIARRALAQNGSGAWLVRFPLAARLGQCCGGVATLLFQHFDDGASEWIAEIERHAHDGTPRALVSRIAADAGRPQTATATAVDEAALAPEARVAVTKLLADPAQTPVLTADGGWFVERIAPCDFRVLVFGNGHVGRALVQVLGTLPCSVTWIDEREDDFPASVPTNVALVATDAPEDEVRHAAPGSMFLVMTHSHALDLELAAAILARGDFSYFGLIGSVSKRTQFERRLSARGVSAARIARMTCPVGLAGIPGKTPGAIAVAIAAELLQLRASGAAVVDRRAAR